MSNFFYICYDRDDMNMSIMGGVWIDDTYGWRFNMSELVKVSEYLNNIDHDEKNSMSDTSYDTSANKTPNTSSNNATTHHAKRQHGLHRECSFEIQFSHNNDPHTNDS